jgi:glycosyltransferase involved in cell wall biosynthesis
MRTTRDLTVCITAFNESENIKGLFDDLDLVHKVYPNLEIVIRDNHSADDTFEKLQALAKDNNSIRVAAKVIHSFEYHSKNI